VITVLLFLITPVLLLFFFRSTRENNKKRVTIKKKLESVAANEFLPRTKKEFQWFILLSITAGICEELLFRGFLIWYFESLTNTLLAVVLSSILFGLAHSYQGVTGILRSGLMGLILALILVWTDSLLILIFLHIAGDVYNGVIGWLGYGEFKNPKLKNG
jgi:membrane protease YdiL (CAAX protease family)